MAADRFDALVIGPDVNNPALAAHLARMGWSVYVIEAAETARRVVRTAEITLPGFRHDIFALLETPLLSLEALPTSRRNLSYAWPGSAARPVGSRDRWADP